MKMNDMEKKIDIDSLPDKEIGRLFPITLVPYTGEWNLLFEKEKELIINVLDKELALTVEHIGSTSVEGLSAKPTIDILVEIPQLTAEIKTSLILKMQRIGYENMRNAEKEKRMTFGKGYSLTGVCGQTYHAHIREKSDDFQNELYFRDYLRQHADIRKEYEKLKLELAERYKFNREHYTNAKTDFILKMTEQAKNEYKKLQSKLLSCRAQSRHLIGSFTHEI
jgi:GrpB-like predicted nucleotidyltransferase (UPF0157 family)